MLKYYIKTTEALKRLRTNEDGVVSLEYVIVAAVVCAVVIAAFQTNGSLAGALSTGFSKITSHMSALN
jgi:pilus assembly protein Flp/PilA